MHYHPCNRYRPCFDTALKIEKTRAGNEANYTLVLQGFIANCTYVPSVPISHRATPYAHTSDALVNSLVTIDSIAIHFHGNRTRPSLT